MMAGMVVRSAGGVEVLGGCTAKCSISHMHPRAGKNWIRSRANAALARSELGGIPLVGVASGRADWTARLS